MGYILFKVQKRAVTTSILSETGWKPEANFTFGCITGPENLLYQLSCYCEKSQSKMNIPDRFHARVLIWFDSWESVGKRGSHTYCWMPQKPYGREKRFINLLLLLIFFFFLGKNNPCGRPKDVATFEPKRKTRLWAYKVNTSTKPKVLMLMENAFKTIFLWCVS